MSEQLSARWQQVIGRDLADLTAMLSKPLQRETLVDAALDLRAYDFDLSLGAQYARRAVEELSSELAKPFEYTSPPGAEADEDTLHFLANNRRAPIERDLAYVKAADSGEWDVALLRRASMTYEEALARVTAKTWSLPDQWRLQSAVILALEVGDVARAASLMAIKRSFKQTKSFHDALALVVAGLAAHDGKLKSGSAEAGKLQDLFDLLRQPERDAANKAFGVNVVNDVFVRRFEFAVLRERYLLGNTGVPDWQRVFRSISA